MVNYNYLIQSVVARHKLLRSLNNQHDGTPKISMKVFSNMVNTVLAKLHVPSYELQKVFEMIFRIYNLDVIYEIHTSI